MFKGLKNKVIIMVFLRAVISFCLLTSLFANAAIELVEEPVTKGDISLFGESTLFFKVEDYGAIANDELNDFEAINNTIIAALESSSTTQPVAVELTANGKYIIDIPDSHTKAQAFSFSAADKVLWIKGNNSKLVSPQLNRGFFRFDKFKAIYVSGLTFDLETMPHSLSKIIEIDEKGVSITTKGFPALNTLAPDDSFFSEPSLTGKFGFFLDSGAKHSSLKGKIVNNSAITVVVQSINKLDDNTYKYTFGNAKYLSGIRPGDLFIRMARTNGRGTFKFTANEMVHVESVKIHASAAGSFNATGNKSVTFDHVTVKPKSGRYYATNADSFHLKNNRSVYIDNAVQESIGDDFINISQNTSLNIESIIDNKITLRNRLSLASYNIGDTIDFFDGINAVILGSANIIAIDSSGNKITFTLSHLVPAEFDTNKRHWMQNSSFEGVVIKNSRFIKSRRHGILVRYPRVLIKNNTIRFNSGAGIAINTENGTTGSFSEDYIGNNITIDNNVFERNAFNALHNSPENEDSAQISMYVQGDGELSKKRLLHDIVIKNNTFNFWVRKGIFIHSVDKVHVSNNKFINRVRSPYVIQDHVIELSVASNVNIIGNSSTKDNKGSISFVKVGSNTEMVSVNMNCISKAVVCN
ncbi:hypothetical protein HWQ46_02245 [Shewanella sp. D64]|uniref:right-handed parallel beta-helix repeat-containing protein n=1 Tax=unclassified Shewanella TaxID=196818 RepID=UPI0022BA6A8C|nr:MULTISPECIES: right-handed parallel beta-helix repeat-containing protein [unclassified Shewanella]MEC4724368.1 hypothetical protein [Shewanella sp. D64]MEC4738880.1 hypothetical protein [Shewanella sp. E94]WBJ97683.1 hypothetical protein HWQ47_11610 [Shewanella sp. MTB7]